MGSWWGASSKQGRERGAVAVEAALVTPVLVVLVFGIIEFSFALRDYVAVSSAVRTGARIASTGADLGPGVCPTDLASPCTPSSSPKLAQEAADAIQRAGSAMPKDSIDYILVYKANDGGYPGTETAMPSSCNGISDCVRFTWRDAEDKFRYSGGSWDSTTISACFPGTAGSPLDRIGVDMHATHKFMTAIFGSSIGLSDHAVMDFEPLPSDSCGPSAPHPHQ